jgi:hypothetical protein
VLKLLLDFVFAVCPVLCSCPPPALVGDGNQNGWQFHLDSLPACHTSGAFPLFLHPKPTRLNCGWREEDVSLYQCCYARARHGRWFLQQPFREDSGAPALPTEVRAGLRFCARLIESAQGERSRIGAEKGSELAHQERHDWTERMPIKRSGCMRCHIFTGPYWRSCLER